MKGDEHTQPEGDGAFLPAGDLPRLGRYQLIRLLGSGGMGAVFAAFDPGLERIVAVKVLHPEVVGGEAAARLRQEAQIMARLAHPNVLPVYDVGEVDGTCFVAMAYVKDGTLADWQQRAPRSREEILAAYVQAGRGLVAAHEAGLVHRDFKPTNALVDDHGRVLVSDFGLAQPASEAAASAPALAGELGALFRTVSRTGVAGTPAYMAPEQHLGLPVDARADQFSFAVALWTALHGRLPFAGTSSRELVESACAGRLDTRPSGLPAPLVAALGRALRAAPAERFPSLREMLAALDLAAWRKRRQRALGAAVLGVFVVAAGAGAWWARGARAVDPCAAGEDRFAGVWDAPRRVAVERAFLATGVSYAPVAFAGVSARLDARREAWLAMRKASCLATRVRREQSDAAMDLRAACLERRLAELRAFASLLARADRAVVEDAVEAAEVAGDVERCADVAALARRSPPPGPPGPLAAVEARVAGLRAEVEAGRSRAALPLAAAVVEESRRTGWAPLVAEAHYLHGRALDDLRRSDAALAAYQAGVLAAEAGGDDELRFHLEILLVVLTGYALERDHEASQHARRAEALLQRLGASDQRLAMLEQARATVDWWLGRYPAARAQAESAIARLERTAPDSPQLARALYTLGAVLDYMHLDEQAVPVLERARDLSARVLGAEHPMTARCWRFLGGALRRLDRFDESEAFLRKALAMFETAAAGEPSFDVAWSLSTLGIVLGQRGDPPGQLAAFERAAELFLATLGPEHTQTGDALEKRGNARTRAGRVAEGQADLERALAIKRARFGKDNPSTALTTKFLAEHHARRNRHALAMPLYAEAVRAYTVTLGAEHKMVGRVLEGQGLSELALGDAPRAVATLRRALHLVGRDAGDAEKIAGVELSLAKALWAEGRARDEALALARRSQAYWRGRGKDGLLSLAEVDAWLRGKG